MRSLSLLCLCLLAWNAARGGVSVGVENTEEGGMFLKDGVFHITGGGYARSKREYLRADYITYDQNSGEITAEGEVMLNAPPLSIFAASASYNMEEHSGLLKGVEAFRQFERKESSTGRIDRGEIDVLVFQAEEIEKKGNIYTARNVSVTTCGMDPAHYAFTAASASFDADSQFISMSECRVLWGGVTLVRLSSIETSIEQLDKMAFPRVQGGSRSDWGWWLSLGYRFPFSEGFDEPAVIHRFDRGPGFSYRRKDGALNLRLGGIYEGSVSSADDAQRAADNLARRDHVLDGDPTSISLQDYLYRQRRLLDTIGTPDNSPILYEDTFRYGIQMSWRGKAGEWNHSLSLDLTSDRNYLYEYERSRFYHEWDRTSYFEAERNNEWAYTELVMRLNLEGFREETEYLPEWRMRTLPFGLPGGLDLEIAARAGILSHTFDEVTARRTFSSFRSHNSVRLSRRLPLHDGVLLNPFLEGCYTWYSEARSGEAAIQAGISYGADLSLYITGKPAPGVTHVIRPVISYINTPQTETDPLNLYDFDEVEDFSAGERLELGLRQEWWDFEDGRAVQLGRLNLETTALLDTESRSNLNSGNLWKPLRIDAALLKYRGFSLLADAVVGLHGEGLLDIYGRIGYKRGLEWGAAGLESVFAAYSGLKGDPSRSILPDTRAEGGISWRSGRYFVEWALGYEFEDNPMVDRGQIYNRLKLTRDFHDVRLTIGLRYAWEENAVRVSLRLEPSGYPPAPMVPE